MIVLTWIGVKFKYNMAEKEKIVKQSKINQDFSQPVSSMQFRDAVFMNLSRTAEIASNLTIAFFCISFLVGIGSVIATIVYPMIVIFNYIFAIAASVFSIGIIYAFGVNFSDMIVFNFSAMDGFSAFYQFIAKALPIFLWVLFGVSVVSFILLLVDKRNKKTGKIVFCGIVMVLSLVLALLFQLGGIVIVW